MQLYVNDILIACYNSKFAKDEFLIYLFFISEHQRNGACDFYLADITNYLNLHHRTYTQINLIILNLRAKRLLYQDIWINPFSNIEKCGRLIKIKFDQEFINLLTASRRYHTVDFDIIKKLPRFENIIFYLHIRQREFQKNKPLTLLKDTFLEQIGADKLRSDSFKKNVLKFISAINIADSKIFINLLKIHNNHKIIFMIETKDKNLVEAPTNVDKLIKIRERIKNLNTKLDANNFIAEIHSKHYDKYLLALEFIAKKNKAELDYFINEIAYLLSKGATLKGILDILCDYKLFTSKIIEAIKTSKEFSTKNVIGWIKTGLKNNWDFTKQVKRLLSQTASLNKTEVTAMSDKSNKSNQIVENVRSYDNSDFKRLEMEDRVRMKCSQEANSWKESLTNEQKQSLEDEATRILKDKTYRDIKDSKYLCMIDNADNHCEWVYSKVLKMYREDGILLDVVFNKKWQHETIFDSDGIIAQVKDINGNVVFDSKKD